MASERTLVKNFYRALIASAYVAGATAAGLALGGPAGAARAGSAAAASLASPLGVASVELGADQATKAALDSKAMAEGGLITQPTFAMLGEAGPEMVIPLAKVKRRVTKKARASRKKLSQALKVANARYRLKNGQLRKGRTQADIMRLAQKLKKKM